MSMSTRSPLGVALNQSRTARGPDPAQINARASANRKTVQGGSAPGDAGRPKQGLLARVRAWSQKQQQRIERSRQEPKQAPRANPRAELQKWKGDRAKWELEIRNRFGSELALDIIVGVDNMEAAFASSQAITLVAQGILNPSHTKSVVNARMWENMIGGLIQGGGGGLVVMVTNTNGMSDAANERTNMQSATVLAYLIDYALGRGATGDNLLLGTHSNGVNSLDGALTILKKTYGRTLTGISILIVAPNCGLPKIDHIAGQLGTGCLVSVFDGVRDTALLGAALAGNRVGYIEYNPNDPKVRATRPVNVSFYRVELPSSVVTALTDWGSINHEAKYYFEAIAAGRFTEFRR
jgi:hypothetical protein